MIQFDEHIFQMGWNHQLDMFNIHMYMYMYTPRASRNPIQKRRVCVVRFSKKDTSIIQTTETTDKKKQKTRSKSQRWMFYIFSLINTIKMMDFSWLC